MKKCKQCGRMLQDECFKQYPSRGKGIYKSTPGRFPTCKECETFNRHANAAWKADPRTTEQQSLVDAAIRIYKDQIAKGLEPIGPLAKSLSKPTQQVTPIEDYIVANLPPDISGIPDDAKDVMLELQNLQSVDIAKYGLAEYRDKLEVLEESLYDVMNDKLASEQKELLNWHWDRVKEFERSSGEYDRVNSIKDSMLKE